MKKASDSAARLPSFVAAQALRSVARDRVMSHKGGQHPARDNSGTAGIKHQPGRAKRACTAGRCSGCREISRDAREGPALTPLSQFCRQGLAPMNGSASVGEWEL